MSTSGEMTVVENQRTGLIRFLVMLVMVFQGIILYLSWRQGQDLAVPALAVVGLVACLYVVARERSLRLRHDRLAEEVVRRRGQVQDLGRRVQKGEGRLKELGQLHQAISAVNSLREPAHVFDAVLKAAQGLAGADCGSLMLLDTDDSDRLRFRCTRGLDEGVESLTLQVGEGLAGRVAQDGQPVLLDNDEWSRKGYLGNAISERAEMQLAMSVPLRMGGDVTGVLSVGATNPEKRGMFNEVQLRHLNVFAQHASMAIQYARLMEGAERASRQRPGSVASTRRPAVAVRR